jgi:hypothetical protein
MTGHARSRAGKGRGLQRAFSQQTLDERLATILLPNCVVRTCTERDAEANLSNKSVQGSTEQNE